MRLLADGELTPRFDADCAAMRDLLNRVGDKWSILIIVTLGRGPLRFGDLRRTIGDISQKVLTAMLRALERDGLIARSVLPTTPPQVQYSLTPLGVSLSGPVRALAQWANDHRADVYPSREVFDQEYR